MHALLTIITVTRNCAPFIDRTLGSILAEKPGDVEYIVIDGASTDGTLDRLSPWKGQIDFLQSEPDNGIYDAMNKGLRAATGEYVLFINAGDSIREEAFSDLLQLLRESSADIYYGDTMLVREEGTEIGLRSERSSRPLPRNLNWKSLQRGMAVSHQAFIVRRDLAPSYDLEYRSSSDIDWVINCLKKTDRIQHTGLVISNYLTGGYSKQRHGLSLSERFAILQKHYGVLPNLFNHLIILSRGIWFAIRGKALN